MSDVKTAASMIFGVGILSTLAMTVFVRTVAAFLNQPFYTIPNLSNMMRLGKPQTRRIRRGYYVMSTILHYIIGILFSYAFLVSVEQDILRLQIRDAILFGILIGTLGILGWRIFFALHPSPIRLDLKRFLATVWLGHLVLAITLLFCILCLY